MKEELIYLEQAGYYDLLYSFKDYEKEVRSIRKVIDEFKKSEGNELLEAACGTGNHLKYLKETYKCVGFDKNSGMLYVAKKKFPDLELLQADMTKFSLGRKFDVVLCMFSSIGYVKTYENLKKTIDNFAGHMKPGGVLLIEPWFTSKTFDPGRPHSVSYDGKDIKIARLNTSKVVDGVSILDFHYLIAERGKPVKHFSEVHRMGLFDDDKVLSFMKDAGLTVKKPGSISDWSRNLFVGVKDIGE